MTTYYVRPTNGNDGNAGTSFAAAFATTQKAVDSATAAGDVIRLCPEAAETISAAIDFDTNTGTEGAPIIIEPGNTTDGAKDLSLTFTITTSSSIHLWEFAAIADYYKVFNVILDGNNAATVCLSSSAADGSDYNRFIGCRFTHSTGDNVSCRGQFIFIDCECDLAGQHGLAHPTANRGTHKWYGGRIHDNVADGWNLNCTDVHIVGAEIYDNGSEGVFGNTNSNRLYLVGCTIYGNTGDGVSLDAADDAAMIYNNSCVGNGGYGFNMHSTNVPFWMDYNHTHGNSSGAADVTLPGTHNQTGDPLFTNVTDGAEDFKPKLGSPLFGNGLMGVTIGARNNVDFPIQDNVTEDDTTASETGQYHEATEAEVQSGVAFGADSALTGTYSAGGGLIRHPGMGGGLNA